MNPLFLLLPALFAAAALPPTTTVRWSTPVMGTTATVAIATPDSTHAWPAAHLALGAMAAVDSLMSNWTQTSEVARINRLAGAQVIRTHPEVSRVLGFALEVGQQSGGAFDVTVEPLVRLWGFLGGRPQLPDAGAIEALLPTVGQQFVQLDAERNTLRFDRPELKIDLGGVAKGYGADRAAARLVGAGVENFLVDISGNMVARGHPAQRDSWTVGVRDPADVTPYFARLQLHNQAVATSGNYEQFVSANGQRFGHILDPRTGWPVSELVSVTVVAPTAMEADAWATAICVLGPKEGRALVSNSDTLRAILIARAPNDAFFVWIDQRLSPAFTLEPRAETRFLVRPF